MSKGYLAIVLHAHLPFVRHPEYDDFLEERWLYEALTETYLPLIGKFQKLAQDKAKFRATMSVSPSLLSMLEDPLLQERYDRYVRNQITLAEKEIERNKHVPHLAYLANFYRERFGEMLAIFEACGRRVSVALKELVDAGVLELGTCSATHGILPALMVHPPSVHAQVAVGIEYFQSVFGFRPATFWLPECAYAPTLDRVLNDHGVRAICVESTAIDHCAPAPLSSVHAPIYTPNGVAAFGRDQSSTKEVWSAKDGYPGHPDYREFYRDIGHELPLDQLAPCLPGQLRVDTGIKYHRITGPGSHKDWYNPYYARERAATHAGDFLAKRIGQVNFLRDAMEQAPIVVAPFDCELFGHWWFEGPDWLDFVMRKTAFDQDVIEGISLSDYLARHPVHMCAEPATSTWGAKGTFETWFNGRTDFALPYLGDAARRMERLVAANPKPKTPLLKRALDQALRELLLAQSSDWPFIIKGGTTSAYAERRTKDHLCRFAHLADAIEKGDVNEDHVEWIEQLDAIFPAIDFRTFKSPIASNA